ncbi:MAG TPA: hypothetical protein PKH21_06090 [Candidatus Cloacimonadota bacterium]|jgi:hypothetical protein|nr:hypothetical protein [Candidatus Cloacimonadota bacterium]HRS50552.1 hypothetical protein [Candidatus Cloacimonadota bacterium]
MKKLILPLLLLVAFGMLAAVESDPSAVVGYVKYPCVAGLNFIALPMQQGFTMATEVGDAIPATMVGTWDPATEEWVTIDAFPWGGWDGTDYAVTTGDPLLISVDADVDFYSIGDLPAPATYSMVAGLNTLMVPLNKSALNMASLVGDDIPSTMVGTWDPATEEWVTIDAFPWGGWDGTDYATTIGMPLLVSVDAATTWPARAASQNIFNVRTK